MFLGEMTDSRVGTGKTQDELRLFCAGTQESAQRILEMCQRTHRFIVSPPGILKKESCFVEFGDLL